MFAKSFKDILQNLEVDDVVVLKGKHINFQGNVVKINEKKGIFEIYVTHSDDEDAIGETLPINDDTMSNVFESLEIKRYKRQREDILALLDFALSIKDYEWCAEIYQELEKHDTREKFLKSRKLNVN